MLRVRHEKRGTSYVILGVARVESTVEEGQGVFIAATQDSSSILLVASDKSFPGSLGRMVMTAQAQSRLVPCDQAVVYIGHDGWTHIRELREFEDGRFTPLPSPTVVDQRTARDLVELVDGLMMGEDGDIVDEAHTHMGSSARERLQATLGRLFETFSGRKLP